MTSVPYNDWLTRERVATEESHWSDEVAKSKGNWQYARAVARAISLVQQRPTVVEFGCGTGWVPRLLADFATSGAPYLRGLVYVGYDLNDECLRLARGRPTHTTMHVQFAQMDMRSAVKTHAPGHIACCFAALKHLPISEAKRMLADLLRAGGCMGAAVFTVALSGLDEDREDECEFVHTRLARATVDRIIADAGHAVEFEEPVIGHEADEILICTRMRR